MKKYEFTGETKQFLEKTVHRIQAVRNFGRIRAGELGGWIEKEENLSHCGNCWVARNACVTGSAWVLGSARVTGNAWVKGNARVTGNACVSGSAYVAGSTVVEGNAWVTEDAYVSGDTHVAGYAQVAGNAWVDGNAVVKGDAWVRGYSYVGGNACVAGNAWVYGNARIQENAYISKTEDYLVVGPIGSRNGYTTFYKNRDNGISVSCGCFSGTIEEFLRKVKKTHGDSKYGKEYIEITNFANKKIKREECSFSITKNLH